MSVSVFEQETTINFSRDMENATVWTSDKTVMTKFDNLCAKNPSDYKCVDIGKSKADGEILSKTYEMPKKYLSFRTCKRNRNITEEEREQMRERALKNLH